MGTRGVGRKSSRSTADHRHGSDAVPRDSIRREGAGRVKSFHDGKGKTWHREKKDRARHHVTLGQGAFGKAVRVYWNDKSNSKVRALKIIPSEKQSPSDVAEEFALQQQASQGTKHVLKAYAFGSDDDGSCILMEQAASDELADHISALGGIEGAPLDKLGSDLLKGVDEMAANGVIHRDLKPENIFAEWGPAGPGKLKIGDFGYAARCKKNKHIEQDRVVGTPNYWAPECLEGRYSAASDVWAAVAIQFELLTGMPLFDADSVEEIAAQIMWFGAASEDEREAFLKARLGMLLEEYNEVHEEWVLTDSGAALVDCFTPYFLNALDPDEENRPSPKELGKAWKKVCRKAQNQADLDTFLENRAAAAAAMDDQPAGEDLAPRATVDGLSKKQLRAAEKRAARIGRSSVADLIESMEVALHDSGRNGRDRYFSHDYRLR